MLHRLHCHLLSVCSYRSIVGGNEITGTRYNGESTIVMRSRASSYISFKLDSRLAALATTPTRRRARGPRLTSKEQAGGDHDSILTRMMSPHMLQPHMSAGMGT